jgi:hypothetical protein
MKASDVDVVWWEESTGHMVVLNLERTSDVDVVWWEWSGGAYWTS